MKGFFYVKPPCACGRFHGGSPEKSILRVMSSGAKTVFLRSNLTMLWQWCHFKAEERQCCEILRAILYIHKIELIWPNHSQKWWVQWSLNHHGIETLLHNLIVSYTSATPTVLLCWKDPFPAASKWNISLKILLLTSVLFTLLLHHKL